MDDTDGVERRIAARKETRIGEGSTQWGQGQEHEIGHG